MTSGILLFVLIYLCCALFFIRTSYQKDTELNKNHAMIIAHELWNLNDSGMKAYLNLAAHANNYRNLKVFTEEKILFLNVDGPEISGLDKFFYNTGLIPLVQHTLPIYYGEEQIGSLYEEQYLRYIYPLFTILLVQFVITLTGIFMLYLVFNRRLLENEVRERTRKYHQLVNLLPEMVLETDDNGIVSFANQKAQACFGFTDLSNNSYDCQDFLLLKNGEKSNKELYVTPLRENLEEKEFKARRNDGQLFPVLIRSAPIFNNGAFIGARLVIVDITERSALEEQLNRDQKMKSIGFMAGGVAHDLNNILSGIVNYPELMIHKVPEDSPLLKMLIPMKEAGLRAAAVVADLLTVARGVAAVKKTANLNQLITAYLDSPEFHKLKSHYPKISYTSHLNQEIDNINCSVIHVKKCLMNLVTNGSEAIEGTGRIEIATSAIQFDTPVQKHGITINPGTYSVLVVKDSGSGISSEDLKQIFEPFYSKKELGRSGTGLGLAVVWNTMQDHNGGVQVFSEKQGSEFSLFFPVSNEEIKTASKNVTLDSYRGDRESILIVDDEEQQLDIASQLLTSLNYTTRTVSSGEEAIQACQEEEFDLLLLDMVLGSGLNGQQTYEEIIKTYPRQKAIIASGYSESNAVKMTMELGAGGLIRKPYTREQLAEAVHSELNRP